MYRTLKQICRNMDYNSDDVMQVRQVTCEVILHSYSLVVDDGYCEQGGQLKPLDTRDCGYEPCPHWNAGPWQEVKVMLLKATTKPAAEYDMCVLISECCVCSVMANVSATG